MSRMPVFAAYQAATTRMVTTESREKRRTKEEGEEGAKWEEEEESFAWRRRGLLFDVDDENGLPKNATAELASTEAEKDEEEVKRAGDDMGGGKNDDGDGFS